MCLRQLWFCWFLFRGAVFTLVCEQCSSSVHTGHTSDVTFECSATIPGKQARWVPLLASARWCIASEANDLASLQTFQKDVRAARGSSGVGHAAGAW
uniref:Putative secreted protein n=1 Tax=Ixodes ricinus TaxID=34613 RepID=A0A6B0UI09_IXORI